MTKTKQNLIVSFVKSENLYTFVIQNKPQMILKLTKLGNSVLVNFQNVTNCEVLHTPQGQFTKIYLVGGTYINVEETMEDILQLQMEFISGNFQSVECNTTNIRQRIEDSYNTSLPRKRIRRERITNTYDI